MGTTFIRYDDVANRLSWAEVVDALRAGHRLPRAATADVRLGPSSATLLSRGAFIPGLGYGVKAVTVFDGNGLRGLPTVQGAMFVFAPEDGRLSAILDSHLVTHFKTAADSVLGALLLARKDSRHLLVVGAGAVARSLVDAYRALFPDLERISVWARRTEQAVQLVQSVEARGIAPTPVADLPYTAAKADIIATATMSREPILAGSWIRPGTHVDLVGAYTPEMREADDALISAGRIFVDCRETTIGHVGDLTIPIESGLIRPDDVDGDLYDLLSGTSSGRRSETEITIYKNGGGAHLDLMTARCIIERVRPGG